MSESIAFAIGCFHFGLKKTYPTGMSGTDYIRELRNSLESIPNANNIEIIAFDDFEKLRIEPKDSFTSIEDGQSFFPPASFFLEIYFDIYIPERLQKELHAGASEDLSTEKFKIHIKDSYHFPVTFIELIGANSKSSPSTAVIVIREFLKRHFDEKQFEFIQFECLGPSPFHADFFLNEGNDEKSKNDYDMNGFSIEYLPQRGYATFDIYYEKSLYSSLQEAREALFLEFSSEAGMFYRIVHHNVLQMREWEKLEELVKNLLETNKATGLKTIWYKAFRLSKQIQDVIIALSEFESGRIWNSFFVRTGYQQLLNDGKELYLNVYLKEELDQFPDYPVGQVKEIIDLLEGRRSKTIDNFIVVVAAVFGGVIGALITLLVTPH